jgi:hypothetical protein
MNDFDLFSLFDDNNFIEDNIIIENKKDGSCIICDTILEVCRNNITGYYEPILCPSCLLDMSNFMNRKS